MVEQEQWIKETKRAVRRVLIDQEFLYGNHTDAEPVKSAVRAQEERVNIDQMLVAFTQNEFNPNSKILAVAEDMANRVLMLEMDTIAGLVVVGSGLHGGANLREAARSGTPDVDIITITRKSIDPDEIRESLTRARMAMESDIPNIAEQYGISTYACEYYNAEYCIDELADIDDARRFFKCKDIDELASNLIVYLTPSIPPEVNQKHRNLIIRVLAEIKQRDPSKWQFIMDTISILWHHVHQLKPKHFYDGTTDRRTEFLVSQVAAKSAAAMSKPFMTKLLKDIELIEKDISLK